MENARALLRRAGFLEMIDADKVADVGTLDAVRSTVNDGLRVSFCGSDWQHNGKLPLNRHVRLVMPHDLGA